MLNFLEALLVAIFCFTMVFTILCVLYLLVKLFTNLIRFIEPKTKE